MPNHDHDKNGGTLEFSDLVDPLDPRRGAVPSTHNLPDPPVAPTLQPLVSSNNTPSDIDEVAPSPANPPPAELPVFRNPLAANTQAHLVEFGAPTATAPTLQLAGNQAAAVRLNLSPLFDTFISHGLSDDRESQPALTLFGKIALKLKLNRFFTKDAWRYVGIGVLSFGIFLLVFNFQTLATQLNYVFSPPKPSAPITATPVPATVAKQTANQAEVAPPGNIVIIPKIKVNAPIILEPSIQEQAIQKSLQHGVIHYAGTALPGERSNMALFGHSSNDWWEPGDYKFVFALLDKLTPGDQVQVNYDQKKYVYQVTGSRIVEPTEISVLQPTSEPQLTLITCTPPGTSWKRLVVVAKQISPVPDQPQEQGQVAQAAAPELALPGNAPSLFDQIKGWFGFGPKPGATPAASPVPADTKRNYLPEAA